MWKNLLLGAAVASLFLTSFVPAVSAAPPCEDRGKLVAQLAQKYQEISVAIGLASNGKLVEVLTNASGDTWTIIVTSPQGMSCLIATGHDWRKLARELEEPQA